MARFVVAGRDGVVDHGVRADKAHLDVWVRGHRLRVVRLGGSWRVRARWWLLGGGSAPASAPGAFLAAPTTSPSFASPPPAATSASGFIALRGARLVGHGGGWRGISGMRYIGDS